MAPGRPSRLNKLPISDDDTLEGCTERSVEQPRDGSSALSAAAMLKKCAPEDGAGPSRSVPSTTGVDTVVAAAPWNGCQGSWIWFRRNNSCVRCRIGNG